MAKRKQEEPKEQSKKAATEENNAVTNLEELIRAIPHNWYFPPIDSIRPGKEKNSTYEAFPHEDLPSYQSVQEEETEKNRKFVGDWSWKLDTLKEQIEQFTELQKQEQEENQEEENALGLINIDKSFSEKDLHLIPPVLRILFDKVKGLFLTADADRYVVILQL